MIGWLNRVLMAPAAQASGAVSGSDAPESAEALRTRMAVLDRDPYLTVADWDANLISVFDEIRYDRADGDFLSVGMRNHAVRKLAPLGFQQRSGTVIENAEADIRIVMPKFHALGASPFDATRYTEKRAQDFFLLTPTQTACRFIDSCDTTEAVARIKELVIHQPVNLLRILDYLEDKPAHCAFEAAIGHLLFVQREAVDAEPLRTRRGLG